MNKRIGLASAAVQLLDSAGFYTKDAGDPLDLLAKKFGDHVSEVMTKLGASNDDLRAIKEQVAEMEQKYGRGGGGSDFIVPDTLGKKFVESERFTDFIEGGFHRSKSGRIDLTVEASLTSLTTDAAGSVGAARSPAYRDALVPLEQRRLTVRDLLPVIQITSGAAEVPVHKGRTNNAAMVAECTAKPQSDIQFELKTFTPREIAHWMKASRQVLEDAPQLMGLIDSELIYGLKLKEKAQLLSGDNTGQNLHGMIPQATAYAAPTVIATSTCLT
jgi:HK97 family phage major capsid protein